MENRSHSNDNHGLIRLLYVVIVILMFANYAVGQQSSSPIITTDLCGKQLINVVKGTSTEPSGSLVKLYQNLQADTVLIQSALVDAGGEWEVSGFNLKSGSVFATVKAPGEIESEPSNEVALVEPLFLTVDSVVEPLSCGGENGLIEISGFEPLTSYVITYDYNTESNTATFTSDAGGIIEIEGLSTGIIDNLYASLNGCTSNVICDILIEEPALPSLTLNQINLPLLCGGLGSIEIDGGVPGETYEISFFDGETTQSENVAADLSGLIILDDLNAGIYSDVTVEKDDCVLFIEPVVSLIDKLLPQIVSILGVDQPSDCEEADGSIEIGGLLPLTTYDIYYEDENGVTQTLNETASALGRVVIDNLLEGAYLNLRVSNLLCISDFLPDVYLFKGPSISIDLVERTCNSGEIQLSGALPNHTYDLTYSYNDSSISASILTDGSGEFVLDDLDAGIYTNFELSEGTCSSNIITDIVNLALLEVPNIELSTFVDPSACLANDGAIVLDGLNELEEYVVSFDDGSGLETLNITSLADGTLVIPDLLAGIYSAISVTNSNGCESNILDCDIALTEIEQVELLDITVASYPDLDDGSLLFNGLSAFTSYTLSYVFEGGAETVLSVSTDEEGMILIEGLSPGEYTNIHIEDGTCVSTPIDDIVIGCDLDIAVSSISNPTSCGALDGTIILEGLPANETITLLYNSLSDYESIVLSSDENGVMILEDLPEGVITDMKVEIGECVSNILSEVISLVDPGDCNSNALYTTLPNTIDRIANADTLAYPSDSDGEIVSAYILSGSIPQGITLSTSTGVFSVSDSTQLVVGTTELTMYLEDETGDVTVTEAIIEILNDKPKAYDDFYFIGLSELLVADDAGGTGSDESKFGLTVNDSDVGNDGLSALLLSSPLHHSGTFEINPDGTFTYEHDGVVINQDSFTYILDDNLGKSDTATVTIHFEGTEAPEANPDYIVVEKGETATALVGGNLSVLDNDYDDGAGPLTAILMNNVSSGNLTLNADGTFSYTNTDETASQDSFTYVADDGNSESEEIMVSISIEDEGTGSGNNEPVGTDDYIVVSRGGNTSLLSNGEASVLANDTDPDDDELTAILKNSVTNGSLSLNPDGTFYYQHNGNSASAESFEYVAFDGVDASTNITVHIVVEDDYTPVAVNDQFSVSSDATIALDILANDYDLDGDLDPTSVVMHQEPEQGDVTIDAEGQIVYTYTGDSDFDALTYSVADDSGIRSNFATVFIQIFTDSNPIGIPDELEVNEGEMVQADLLANDMDLEDNLDPSSMTIISQPEHGSISIISDGNVEYVHDGTETVFDEFEYQVADEEGLTSNPTKVFITVNPVNDSPLALDDTASVDISDFVVINPLNNDLDVDGEVDPNTLEITKTPDFGYVEANIDGTVTYRHDSDLLIPDHFEYTIRDEEGAVSEVARVSITINEADGVEVPNVFTPNGDGKNDFWFIDGIESYPNNQVAIYNRWGNKIFEISRYDNNTRVWDSQISVGGTLGSTKATSGTYFYVIKLNESSEPLSGYIVVRK